MTESQVLDQQALAELKEMMGSDFPLLLQTYFEDAQQQLAAMEQALQQHQAEALRQAAHSFKGSCANMGAQVLAKACFELERTAQAENWSALERCFSEIQTEYPRVKALLTEGAGEGF